MSQLESELARVKEEVEQTQKLRTAAEEKFNQCSVDVATLCTEGAEAADPVGEDGAEMGRGIDAPDVEPTEQEQQAEKARVAEEVAKHVQGISKLRRQLLP
jgi:hypothetical protein